MSVTVNPAVGSPLPRLIGLTGEWYAWLARHELRFQRCSSCGRWRHLPRLLCPRCSSSEWRWERSQGSGTVYTWSTTHRVLHPAFAQTPFAATIVELDEGPRVLTSMVDVAPRDLEIGMPVEAIFDDVTDAVTLARFRRAEAELS